MSAVYLNHMALTCALGASAEAARSSLHARSPRGVSVTDRFSPGRALHLGCVGEVQALSDDVPEGQRSRSNALLAAALAPLRQAARSIVDGYGPDRVAVVIGSSTSGVLEGEAAAAHRASHGRWPEGFHYAQQELGSGAAFIARELSIRGPAYVISTACSSGAKVFASAARLLNLGVVDAVVVGAADVLSRFTVEGFLALDSVSPERCNPLSARRRGINLGEGAALFVMSRLPGPVRLAGWGETSDAHHMSAPDPSGTGAFVAMSQALTRAGLVPRDVDYINLHGTATRQNDAMESLAVNALFGDRTPVSSTKPLTGHTLAAAGAIEAAFAWLTLVGNPQGLLPPHWWDGERDPELPELHVVQPGESLGRPVDYVLSNSFAFGGSNASLIFART